MCSSAALGLHHADDACPPETCAQHGHDGTEISIEISIRLQMHSRE